MNADSGRTNVYQHAGLVVVDRHVSRRTAVAAVRHLSMPKNILDVDLHGVR